MVACCAAPPPCGADALKRGPPFKRPRRICQARPRAQKIFSNFPRICVPGAVQEATIGRRREHKSTARGDRVDLRALNRASGEAEAGRKSETRSKPKKPKRSLKPSDEAARSQEAKVRERTGVPPEEHSDRSEGPTREEDDRGTVAHSVLSRSPTREAGVVPPSRLPWMARSTFDRRRGIGAAIGGFPAAPRRRSQRAPGSPVVVGTEGCKVCVIVDTGQRPVPNK